MRIYAPAAPAQCCFPEPKPPAQADAGRRSDAPARSKEPRRASTRRLVPRKVRAVLADSAVTDLALRAL